jgi:hypothetical protein
VDGRIVTGGINLMVLHDSNAEIMLFSARGVRFTASTAIQ